MRRFLRGQIDYCLREIQYLKDLDLVDFGYSLTWSRQVEHGDFACNIAMLLAKKLRSSPIEIARKLTDELLSINVIEKIEVAGPGFINIYVRDDCFIKMLFDFNNKGVNYSLEQKVQDESLILEYVSANPTGPLHVGHGRGAALGSALANILTLAGYDVRQEYYVNDAGRQMRLLGLSCFVRILQQLNVDVVLPAGCYKGEYVAKIAALFVANGAIDINKFVEIDFNDCADDKAIDSLIEQVSCVWGEDNFLRLCDFAGKYVLDEIKADLEVFGVKPEWFSEQELLANSEVGVLLQKFAKDDLLYEKDGAVWFRSLLFGDDKDRVLQRANKQLTYFAADAAYHGVKCRRYKNLINIWGADHHGYVPRIKAVLQALGFGDRAFKCLLVQFVSLVEGKKKVSMSTRSGDFITLSQLVADVGVDVCRFFYLMRKSDQHIEFDLELARKNSQENPVYYIQYAYARICSILRQVDVENLVFSDVKMAHLGQHAKPLLVCLAQYNEVLLSCIDTHEVYLLAVYLQNLAGCLHRYYNLEVCLVEDVQVRDSRLLLLLSVKAVIEQGLSLLGVSCPEKM